MWRLCVRLVWCHVADDDQAVACVSVKTAPWFEFGNNAALIRLNPSAYVFINQPHIFLRWLVAVIETAWVPCCGEDCTTSQRTGVCGNVVWLRCRLVTYFCAIFKYKAKLLVVLWSKLIAVRNCPAPGHPGVLFLTWINIIPSWISSHIPSNMWHEITYPFPNLQQVPS